MISVPLKIRAFFHTRIGKVKAVTFFGWSVELSSYYGSGFISVINLAGSQRDLVRGFRAPTRPAHHVPTKVVYEDPYIRCFHHSRMTLNLVDKVWGKWIPTFWPKKLLNFAFNLKRWDNDWWNWVELLDLLVFCQNEI